MSKETKSGAVGIITDHQNGTYTAMFRLLWEGEVTIRIQLILPRQAIDVIARISHERPVDLIIFQKRYTGGKRDIDKRCNIDPVIFKNSAVCNYSDPHAGVWWYCEKPVNISCNTPGYHSKLRYSKENLLKTGEEKLFGRRITALKMPITGYPSVINVKKGGPNDVVGITMWAHFTSYPVGVYRKRMEAVRAAIERLLHRSPETLVVIKSANTRKGDVIIAGDWHAYRLDRVMREVFRGMKVVLLDAWEMTNAQHWHEDNIHPAQDIIEQELEFLSRARKRFNNTADMMGEEVVRFSDFRRAWDAFFEEVKSLLSQGDVDGVVPYRYEPYIGIPSSRVQTAWRRGCSNSVGNNGDTEAEMEGRIPIDIGRLQHVEW
ncbi:NXPE3 [Branchiostoma lanceolatum]|uniref:NXPE3 protein n=1 Tax=Branchiostoma lanceolatum TaxID=7740 RepID=A0A8J9ZAZ8_BRALA|nr:NXPE3 [Branchiostoma lanceolatum]